MEGGKREGGGERGSKEENPLTSSLREHNYNERIVRTYPLNSLANNFRPPYIQPIFEHICKGTPRVGWALAGVIFPDFSRFNATYVPFFLLKRDWEGSMYSLKKPNAEVQTYSDQL